MGKKKIWNKAWLKYLMCVCAGAVFFMAAEAVDRAAAVVDNGVIHRNPWGKGEAVYELYVEGLEPSGDGEGDSFTAIELHVPELELSDEQFEDLFPEIAELLCGKILGTNGSLQEVRSNLQLVKELPEYGLGVHWESDFPEILGADGCVGLETEPGKDAGYQVYLEASLTNGSTEKVMEIPITVYPRKESVTERFVRQVNQLILQNPGEEEIVLPTEFEGRRIGYQSTEKSQNVVLLLLGIVAAFCLFFKEKEDAENEKKYRERALMAEYPDLVYAFLILTGAGLSVKGAWKKLVEDAGKDVRKRNHPLYQEMQVAVNQMSTGMPEVRAYAEFGRRCGIRSYMKFASLLETSVNTGGKNLRKLLEEEVEEAFQVRVDMARRNGETASSKLLLPMFGMLGVVLIMVVAPAFLSLNS